MKEALIIFRFVKENSMKKNSLLLLILLLMVSCKIKSEKYIYYFDWPVEANTGYILMEQGNCINSVYGNHFVNSHIFIGGKEGQTVYAPADCTVKYINDIEIFFPDGITSMSWENKESFLEDKNKPNYSFMTEDNISSTIGFTTSNGREFWITGLIDYSLQVGEHISKGQKIGNMGFIKTFFDTPCISLCGELKTDAFIFNNQPEKVFTINLEFKDYNPQKKLSKTQLLEDFDLFYKYIYEDHPSLINSEIKKDFIEKSTNIRNKINNKESIAEFKKQLLRCTATLNCSHTKLTNENPKQSDIVFPLLLEYEDGKCKLVADLREKKKLENCLKIISINGKEISKIYNEMTECIGFDSTTYDVREELNKYILLEYYSFYGRSVITTVKYLDSNGKKKTTFVSPMSKLNMKNITSLKNVNVAPKYSDIFTIVNDNEAYITIQRIDQLSNKEKINNIFRQIKDLGIKNLYIDLRDNPGGDIENVAFFFSFFANQPYKMYEYLEIRHFEPYISIENSLNLFKLDRDLFCNNSIPFTTSETSSPRLENYKYYEAEKDLHFDGNCTVLINASTSSAAVRLAQLLYENGAKLEGTETSGGAYYSNGLKFTQVLLPNSNIILEIPLYRVVYKDEILKSEGLRP